MDEWMDVPKGGEVGRKLVSQWCHVPSCFPPNDISCLTRVPSEPFLYFQYYC